MKKELKYCVVERYIFSDSTLTMKVRTFDIDIQTGDLVRSVRPGIVEKIRPTHRNSKTRLPFGTFLKYEDIKKEN